MPRLLKFAVYLLVACSVLSASPDLARAGSKAEIDASVDGALKILEAHNPDMVELAKKSVGVLVFPRIIKGGLLIGGAYGEGALRQNGKTTGYYNSVAVSYGLQAGAQAFGYALFFMNEKALAYVNESAGWEIGSGPSVVVMDEGMAMKMSTTTLSQDVYAVIFNQAGLMAGLGIEGSKITRIKN